MTAKSPTASLKRREVIGEEQFTQRREVFDKHDTVFMPTSPTVLSPSMDVEVEISVNGDAGNHFKRSNAYSSMRETRKEDFRQENGYRNRKYSDNFTSETNQNDEVDYRRSLADRTRRLSKLRRDFLASNLHDDPSSPDPFARSGTRASLPVRNGSINYKKESPTLFKFPFAEPYSTPPPTRRVIVDLGPIENGTSERNSEEKENECPDKQVTRQSLPNGGNVSKVDHHKVFEELIKRYSPQRKPVDWSLPPTKPKVIGAIHKSTSDSVDSSDGKKIDNDDAKPMNELFIDESKMDSAHEDTKPIEEISANSENSGKKVDEPNADTISETEEKKDKLVELELIKRQLSRDAAKRPNVESKHPDPTIPDLLEKINHADDERKPKSDKKKVKRKRSFLDKLLGRKKEK